MWKIVYIGTKSTTAATLLSAAVYKRSVAQEVRRWPIDLAVPGSRPACDLFNCKRGSIAHSHSLLPDHRPDMTIILFNRMQNRKSSISIQAFVIKYY